MPYNNKNIVLHELIGLDVEIINSSDRSQIGITGRIIDEGKNTFSVETSKGIKTVVKKISTLKIAVPGIRNGSFVVEGTEIGFRPHERIEKGLKFYKRRRL